MQNNWPQFQTELQAHTTPEDYASWLAPLTESSHTNNTLTIAVPTRFMQDWLEDNFQDVLKAACQKIYGDATQIAFVVTPVVSATIKPALPTDMQEASSSLAKNKKTSVMGGTPLDPTSTFANFVTGSSNEFAYQAAQGITNALKDSGTANPAYNPFFLHGGVGLGKTHLMHAIGAALTEADSKKNILYISAEQFFYRFIRALQDKSMLTFKQSIRNVDILMIDDIQFIASKGATQDEFFHTFNSLVADGKQIILTADRSPHELDNIEDRLKSRLGSGLTAKVTAPEVETRLAILNQKAENMGLDLTPDVAEFMANRIQSNVRELEGALNRLAAHAKFVGATISLPFAQEQLKDLTNSQRTTSLTINTIQEKVATYYAVKPADILGKRRQKNLVQARQMAMYLAKQLTPHSLPEIGRAFGGKDHTTVMHAVRKITDDLHANPALKSDAERLIAALS